MSHSAVGFATRKVTKTANSEPLSSQVVLRVTCYEKGNRLARAMLAGLGQIHLEGTTSVFQMHAQTAAARWRLP